MAVHHRLTHTASLGKLDGVYGLRQPGFSPHPVLKHRQQQRTELRRSASLVLAQSKSPALAVVRDVERPRDLTDWSTDFNPSTPLRPIKGAPWQSWVQPTFMNEVPPRLEECQIKLAAVERELNRYSKAAGGSGFRAVKQQHELPAWAQDYQDMCGQETLSRKSFSLMQAERPLSSSYGMAEPAPEPMAASWSCPEATEGPEIQLEDDSAGEVELDDEDISGQLSEVQAQLKELDLKWQKVDDDRQTAKQQRDQLELRLETARDQEYELKVKVADLQSQVKDSEDERQSLCRVLSVSEEEARELRQRLGTLALGERALQAQTSELLARLQSLQGEASEMRARACKDGEGQEPSGCRLSPVADLEMAQAKSMDMVELEERKKARAELESVRSAAQRRQADLENELAAATERHRLAEAELERVTLLEQERSEMQAAGTGQANQGTDGDLPPAAAVDTPLANMSMVFLHESPALASEIPAESVGVGTEKSGVRSPASPNAAAIPELVFVTDLTSADDRPTIQQDGKPSPEPSFPANCQVHLATNELCLQVLKPLGPLCSIPLASIVATRPDNSTGTVVELELEGFTDGPVRLATADEHAASALVAALGVPDRVAPGFGIGIS